MEWPDLGRGVFATSVAAELSGLHPQTLRVYEREALVEPGRSAGGTRLYRGTDVAGLREIAAQTSGGLNVAGVKLVLELQEEIRRLQAEVDRLGNQIARARRLEVLPSRARPARAPTRRHDNLRTLRVRRPAGRPARRSHCPGASRCGRSRVPDTLRGS